MDRVKINTNIDAANKDGKVACCGSVICGRALGVYEWLKYARGLGYNVIDLNVDSISVVQVIKIGWSRSLGGYALVKNNCHLQE
jgi:hypothetical protein